MFRDPRHAYDTGARSATNNRELESAALSKAARQLEDVRQNWDRGDQKVQLDAALAYNRRLWTFFQTELAAVDHPMPRDLRVSLLRLSGFVDQRMIEVQAHPEPEKLKALIDINRQIAAGLSRQETAERAA